MNNRHGLKWTNEEIELLRSDIDSKELAEKLGRSYSAVTTKRTIISRKPKSNYHDDVYSVKEESPFRAELIYPNFYLNVPIGRKVLIQTSSEVTEDTKVKNFMKDAVIIKKYPYYCKVVETKTRQIRCIQWSDIARFNMDVFDLYGGKYGR